MGFYPGRRLVNKLSFYSSSFCCACQPGTHRNPGTQGIPGRDRRDRLNGNQGPPRNIGAIGPRGLQGAKRETAIQDPSERKGEPGETGTSGINGTPVQMHYKNWKECAWQNLNDGRDNGLIKVPGLCTMTKMFLLFLLFIGPDWKITKYRIS